jgi:hypothetical protein
LLKFSHIVSCCFLPFNISFVNSLLGLDDIHTILSFLKNWFYCCIHPGNHLMHFCVLLHCRLESTNWLILSVWLLDPREEMWFWRASMDPPKLWMMESQLQRR